MKRETLMYSKKYGYMGGSSEMQGLNSIFKTKSTLNKCKYVSGLKKEFQKLAQYSDSMWKGRNNPVNKSMN